MDGMNELSCSHASVLVIQICRFWKEHHVVYLGKLVL